MRAAKTLLALTACTGVFFASAALAGDTPKLPSVDSRVLITQLPKLAAADTQTVIHAAEAEAKTEKKDLILKGDAKCTGCHDEADDSAPGMLELHPSVLSIGKTKHGTQADGRTPTCTDCHGGSDKHATYKGSGKPPKPDILYTKNTPTPAEMRNERCLTCHQGNKRIGWQSSTHATRDVACVSCHQVHDRRDKTRDRFAQTEICYTCHKQQRAEMSRPTHHPVPEGEMGCSSCHDPHSDNPKALIKSSTNDTCYTCHMEKRGPFVNEHQPVAEDCAVCHKPHGTVTPSLLTQRPPILCQQCHGGTGHASVATAPTPANTVTSRNYLGGRSCMGCHANIHGSNAPSATGAHLRQ
jgi:DmsE family decaheme c-type cytochrome